MIVDRSSVGRYEFIFDLNDGQPFNPRRYFTIYDKKSLSIWQPLPGSLEDHEIFGEKISWLRARTSAFRIHLAEIRSGIGHEGIHGAGDIVHAVVAEVPEAHAVLFRMFCYDG